MENPKTAINPHCINVNFKPDLPLYIEVLNSVNAAGHNKIASRAKSLFSYPAESAERGSQTLPLALGVVGVNNRDGHLCDSKLQTSRLTEGVGAKLVPSCRKRQLNSRGTAVGAKTGLGVGDGNAQYQPGPKISESIPQTPNEGHLFALKVSAAHNQIGTPFFYWSRNSGNL